MADILDLEHHQILEEYKQNLEEILPTVCFVTAELPLPMTPSYRFPKINDKQYFHKF